MAFTEADVIALRELEALARVPGALKIITNEHACGVHLMPRDPADLALCAQCPYPVTDPRHFVLHDVTSLIPREDKGRVRACSAEGDYTEGKPEHVLSRLRQWRVN